MGREIRRVPPNWEHPKETVYNYLGVPEERYKSLYDQSYLETLNEWIDDHLTWEAGTHRDLLGDDPVSKADHPHYASYGGNPPNVEDYRPDWKPEEMTWYQVYETVSEGTPVTPPFETKEEIVEYLVQHGDFWDQKRRQEGDSIMRCDPWTREQAERFVGVGWAPSFIGTSAGIVEGAKFIP